MFYKKTLFFFLTILKNYFLLRKKQKNGCFFDMLSRLIENLNQDFCQIFYMQKGE